VGLANGEGAEMAADYETIVLDMVDEKREQ